MSKPASTISEGSLQSLYLQRGPAPSQLVLQLLAFQVSECNPKEIILRLSDRQAFLDCLLVGPYAISDSRIVSTEYSHSRSSQLFQRNDLLRVSDFFVKIDPMKICHLRIIVRRLDQTGTGGQVGTVLGRPEEISEFVQEGGSRSRTPPTVLDNNKLIARGTEETPIKLEEIEQVYQTQEQNPSKPPPSSNHPTPPPLSDPRKQDQPLILEEILAGKPGYFIGRLVRIKFGCKQSKEGPMSFLYLGFIDSQGSLVRIHLAGRTALKESKQLRRGRVYFIKGVELFHGEKVKCAPQIRLKDKEYKIHEIQNQTVRGQYKHEYYCWEHEHEWVESQMVDVIGVVEGIEEKITYKNSNTYQEQRDVVRLSIRNAFKTVKISFWADHIAIIENLQLQRKQPIIIEDIKKKKSIFLDFISESNIILLDEQPELKERFAHLLPPFQQAPDPSNIKELLQVCSLEPYSSKIRSLTARIASINPKWIIYKMCNPCKKKVEKVLEACLQCQKAEFVYKYNCAFELADGTGILSCIAFDPVCQKVFGKNANEFSLLGEEGVREACERAKEEEWRVGVEYKNSRQIIRSAERLSPVGNQREEVSKLEPFGKRQGNQRDQVSKLQVFGEREENHDQVGNKLEAFQERKLEASQSNDFHEE